MSSGTKYDLILMELGMQLYLIHGTNVFLSRVTNKKFLRDPILCLEGLTSHVRIKSRSYINKGIQGQWRLSHHLRRHPLLKDHNHG